MYYKLWQKGVKNWHRTMLTATASTIIASSAMMNAAWGGQTLQPPDLLSISGEVGSGSGALVAKSQSPNVSPGSVGKKSDNGNLLSSFSNALGNFAKGGASMMGNMAKGSAHLAGSLAVASAKTMLNIPFAFARAAINAPATVASAAKSVRDAGHRVSEMRKTGWDGLLSVAEYGAAPLQLMLDAKQRLKDTNIAQDWFSDTRVDPNAMQQARTWGDTAKDTLNFLPSLMGAGQFAKDYASSGLNPLHPVDMLKTWYHGARDFSNAWKTSSWNPFDLGAKLEAEHLKGKLMNASDAAEFKVAVDNLFKGRRSSVAVPQLLELLQYPDAGMKKAVLNGLLRNAGTSVSGALLNALAQSGQILELRDVVAGKAGKEDILLRLVTALQNGTTAKYGYQTNDSDAARLASSLKLFTINDSGQFSVQEQQSFLKTIDMMEQNPHLASRILDLGFSDKGSKSLFLKLCEKYMSKDRMAQFIKFCEDARPVDSAKRGVFSYKKYGSEENPLNDPLRVMAKFLKART